MSTTEKVTETIFPPLLWIHRNNNVNWKWGKLLAWRWGQKAVGKQSPLGYSRKASITERFPIKSTPKLSNLPLSIQLYEIWPTFSRHNNGQSHLSAPVNEKGCRCEYSLVWISRGERKSSQMNFGHLRGSLESGPQTRYSRFLKHVFADKLDFRAPGASAAYAHHHRRTQQWFTKFAYKKANALKTTDHGRSVKV